MVFVTGDLHGNFERFKPKYFPEQARMTKQDIRGRLCRLRIYLTVSKYSPSQAVKQGFYPMYIVPLPTAHVKDVDGTIKLALNRPALVSRECHAWAHSRPYRRA